MPLEILYGAFVLLGSLARRKGAEVAALASLGIRMNFEGTGKSVKADVVIGDDGVAQAIRLVQ